LHLATGATALPADLGSHGRKPIRRGRSASSSAFPPGLADPEIRGRARKRGTAKIGKLRFHLGKFIADETEKCANVVKFAAIKPI
jgi:hypothetical protein